MFKMIAFLADAGAWIASLGTVAIVAIGLGIYLPRIREIAFAVAIAAASSTFFMAKGVHLGVDLNEAKWVAKEKATADRGAEVRKEAEHDIAISDAGRDGDASVGVRLCAGDKFCRDRGTVQRVAPDNLRRQGHPQHGPANPGPQPGGAPVGVLGVIKPSENYPCWRIQQAFAALSKENIAEISKEATPAQRAAALKCLDKRGMR